MNTQELKTLESELGQNDWTLCYDCESGLLSLLGGSSNSRVTILFHDKTLIEIIPTTDMKIFLNETDRKLIQKVSENYDEIIALSTEQRI